MKDTQENKEKFFAQYWGQCVGVIKDVCLNGQELEPYYIMDLQKEDYLELTNLKDISDEDLKELSIITNPDLSVEINNMFEEYKHDLRKSFPNNIEYDQLSADYLRSKGYLVPWMGLSCEEIIKRGWAKHKEV